ncbi:MAG: hypothetical protein IKH04_09605 [Kiritimatiellae bacterium]|nr:hypothetical protein [Kiritimatiellia bacterium]
MPDVAAFLPPCVGGGGDEAERAGGGEIPVRLHGRREIPVVHEGRANPKALRGRETLHLVLHFVKHLAPDFPPPLDFQETGRLLRLD